MKIYKNSTHTDKYLNFNSHHPLHQKLGVVRTLFDRANSLIMTEENRFTEINNLKAILRLCDYRDWTFRQVERMMKAKKVQLKRRNPKSEYSTPSGKLVVLPYVKGLMEAIARTVAFRPANNIRQLTQFTKWVVRTVTNVTKERPPDLYMCNPICATKGTPHRGRDGYQHQNLYSSTEKKATNTTEYRVAFA